MKDGLYNTNLAFWKSKAAEYRKRPQGGPTVCVLEGHVWCVPSSPYLGGGYHAQFKNDEDAERIFLRAGFHYVPEAKGWRADKRRAIGGSVIEQKKPA